MDAIEATSPPLNTNQIRLSISAQKQRDSIAKEDGQSYKLALKDEASNTGNNNSIIHAQASSIFLNKQCSALPSFAVNCKFEWKNLNVYLGNNDKQILYDINGSINSGELLAVMGGSGAGKSTLLNALSGRTNLNQQRLDGYLSINNKKFKCSNQSIIKSLCTFVPQSDILCPTQTVFEALIFYAKLKLSHLSHEKQIKRVNYLIDVLHLNKCKNNLIGDEKKRGISGGEKRRVSIAAEILNDVDIIFLDEPTSGLDAYTAERTIKTLKQLAVQSNKIIIATIHQPSIQVFYLFDKLILLSHGKCCFNSFTEDIHIYFKDKLRSRTNPADIVVFEVQKHSDEYAQKWNKSLLNNNNNINQCISYRDDENDTFDINENLDLKTNGKMPSKCLQSQLLLKREIRGLWRNKRVSIIRIIQIVFFASASGLCYFDIKQSFTERAKAFFLLTIMPMLFGIVSLLTVFPKQKLLFQREYNSKTYNVLSWALSFMIIEIPREIIHMLIFTVITYFMIDLDGNIFLYWLTFLLTSLSGGSLGILFGTVCKTTVEAAQSVPAALIPLLIFSDGIIRVHSLPGFVQWIAKINPFYYLMRCLFIIEFYGVIYPRNLSNDERELCERYELHFGPDQDIGYNNTYPPFNNTISYLNTSYDIKDADGKDLPGIIDGVEQGFNITFPYNESALNNTDYSEEHAKINEFCMEEIPWTYFFDSFGLTLGSLKIYWLLVIAICIALRFISILILLGINNNTFSWIYNKILSIFACQCLSNFVANQVPTDSQQPTDTEETEETEESKQKQLNDIQEENDNDIDISFPVNSKADISMASILFNKEDIENENVSNTDLEIPVVTKYKSTQL